MKVLLAVETTPGGEALRAALEEGGHLVVGPAAGVREAVRLARGGRAEVAVVALPAGPEAAEALSGECSLPVVLVSSGADPDALERVAHLPVFACLVEPVAAETLGPVLRLARARFAEWSALRARVAELTRELAGRKTVERAKGIIMQVRGLSEGEAYRLLRRESQNRRVPVADVASTIVSMEGVYRASAGRSGGA